MGSKKRTSNLPQPQHQIVEALHKDAKFNTDMVYSWLTETAIKIDILDKGKAPSITQALAFHKRIRKHRIPLPQNVAEAWLAAIRLRTEELGYYLEDFERRYPTSREKETKRARKARKSNEDHGKLIESLREAYDHLINPSRSWLEIMMVVVFSLLLLVAVLLAFSRTS
ncbi:MAG: hypothetical protein L6R38_008345 [Xanthoria sp. 2 TBL-2021]|nr:MAG: hypothetical protein L6R38_008345 [Xanthoria sp. 2 TBL-2021]